MNQTQNVSPRPSGSHESATLQEESTTSDNPQPQPSDLANTKDDKAPSIIFEGFALTNETESTRGETTQLLAQIADGENIKPQQSQNAD